MSQGNNGPKFGPRQRPTAVNTAVALSDHDVLSSVRGAIQRAYRGNLKLVAKAADVREDTAKNWMEGRNAPNLATFFRLARNCPDLKAEAMRLMTSDETIAAEHDPEFMRDVMNLMQSWQRMKERERGVP